MTRERKRLRLSLGMTHLEEWAATAGQADKNALYKMLFAVADGSVFRTYKVLDDVQMVGEFFVLVREDLVVKVSFPRPGTFGVLYIGSPAEGPFRDVEAA
ncbi:DUF6235 family protein [Actinokineospora sp. 24-640]